MYKRGNRHYGRLAAGGGNGHHQGSSGLLDKFSPTGAWSASRNLLSSYAGVLYTTQTGVNSWKDQSGNARNADNAANNATQPTPTTAGPNSKACLDFPACVLDSVAISNFISSSAGYIVISFIADTITQNIAQSYSNDQLIADTGGFMGLFLRNTDANPANPDTIYAFNWDGNEDNASAVSIIPGTAYVAEWRHEGGNMFIRINGGAWSAGTPSGNTAALTGVLRFGTTTKFDGKIFEAAIFSTVPASGDQDIIAAGFKSWVGA